MVQLPGKRNRKVPLILKPEWVKSMELLVENRDRCNVVNNVYFFGQPSKTNHIVAWKVSTTLTVLLYSLGSESLPNFLEMRVSDDDVIVSFNPTHYCIRSWL
jgi:hypothetical protein